ncbi:toxin glutamine deamidase domain-containing protein, partial [Streptomyces pinistramenti]|uniref:toxin glutamine deamidase domain-containing protein n=1 Tax=Streptomyces pinistramenti TaxID=2884812 RepID=UPI001D08FFE6
GSDPTPASDTRNRERPGGLDGPTDAHQQQVENSIPRDENGNPQRHPDPDDGHWVDSINDPGPDAPGRSNNCVDAALAATDTFAGHPTAAAHRTPDTHLDGTPSDRGENNGRDRIENTLGARFHDYGNGRDAFNRLENALRNSGHGSQAVIITQDSNGRAHAWNVVNHHGKITYVDAQTGQCSNKPLHNGDNGVHAIPLDANRRPVGNVAARPAQDPHPDQRPGRRPAAEPGHGNQRSPEGSTPYGERQPSRTDSDPSTESHRHYEMDPETSQDAVRGSHDVNQVNLDPIHQNLQNWLRDGQLNALLDSATTRNVHNEGFTHDELSRALPGFDAMEPGERGAVVASLARLSLSFHRDNAVGHNPLSLQQAYADMNRVPPNQQDVSRGVHYHERADVFGRKGNPARQAFDHARDHYGTDDQGVSLAQRVRRTHAMGDHRPDFTARNYAVLEVHDPGTNETRYVVDSSIPQQTPDEVHSEPHLGNHLDLVNEHRKSQNLPPFQPINLYTEREPCGNISGSPKADCSSYIHNSETLHGVSVNYSVGFRRGELSDAATDSKRDIQKMFSEDFQNHLNRLMDIWMESHILRDRGY